LPSALADGLKMIEMTRPRESDNKRDDDFSGGIEITIKKKKK